MSTTVRWGIAGTGYVARLFAEGLAYAPGARLQAVGSRDRSRAEAFAARYGALRAHAAYEGLATDADVDVVYVATPHSEHKANTLRMLEAGKAVLCEKPFALDASEASEMIALARKKKIFCMEAMWTRFLPAVSELVGRIRAGELGEIQSATMELGHPFALEPRHRLFDPALGGGALLDLGVYGVSLASWLFGPPSDIQSQVVFGPSNVDEHVTALLGHPGRRQSIIVASLRTRLSNGASIAGTAGWARLHDPLYRPPAFSIQSCPRQAPGRGPATDLLAPRRKDRIAWLRPAVRTVRSVAAPVTLGLDEKWISRPYRGNGYGYQAVEVMRCMREGLIESPTMPLDETLRIMETLDSIRRNWRVL